MPRPSAALRALLPFALHGLARALDASLGVLLHTSLDVPGLAGAALRLLDGRAALLQVAAWTLGGAAAWALLAAAGVRRRRLPWREAFEAEAGAFGPLLLRPTLTALALLSVALRPAYPFAFTLPVALTQDWAWGQDAAALAALLAARLPLPGWRLPAPRARAVFGMALLAYALLTPERVRHWQGHPGNEPKYLRMGLSLGHALSLDVEASTTIEADRSPLEILQPLPFPAAVAGATRTLWRESLAMAAAVGRGPEAVGASAIRARRLARQTVAGKDGGVFHVLAPGPSLLLAPTLRLDRALNLRHGKPGRLAVTVLAWNAMAAALVAALYLLLCDATGQRGLSAALAAGFALTPPFLFYFFQFYPEMPGALLMTVALRALVFERRFEDGTLLGLGLATAALPWLHQKFLPVWGVLVVIGLLRAVDALASLRGLLALLLPQAASLYLTALYNFGIAGSLRPDALFLAWGPRGVTSQRIGEGALGLLLDARYGLLPYAPIYLLAAGGVALALAGGGAARRLMIALPAVLAYYLTVAAADNWSGAVCNLGRYVMPVAPFLIALLGVALVRARGRGVWALALTLAAWTGALALALWEDPRAANDSALLLSRSAVADGDVYIPNLFFRSWNYAAPGHAARLAAWLGIAALAGAWLLRAARGRGGRQETRLLAGLLALGLAAGGLLERWPTPRRGTRFPGGLDVAPGVLAYADGATLDGGRLRASGGDVELLVRSPRPLPALRVWAAGDGVLRVAGRAPLAIGPRGAGVDVPLATLVVLTGRRGAQEALARGRFEVEGSLDLRLAPAPGGFSAGDADRTQ